MTKREAVPHIDREAEYYLNLSREERRRLPFAAPCITPDTVYRAQRQQPAPAAPAPKKP